MSLVKLGLSDHSPLEESLSGAIEGTVKQSKEDSSFFAQDLAGLFVERAENIDVAKDFVRVGSHGDEYRMLLRICVKF